MDTNCEEDEVVDGGRGQQEHYEGEGDGCEDPGERA